MSSQSPTYSLLQIAEATRQVVDFRDKFADERSRVRLNTRSGREETPQEQDRALLLQSVRPEMGLSAEIEPAEVLEQMAAMVKDGNAYPVLLAARNLDGFYAGQVNEAMILAAVAPGIQPGQEKYRHHFVGLAAGFFMHHVEAIPLMPEEFSVFAGELKKLEGNHRTEVQELATKMAGQMFMRVGDEAYATIEGFMRPVRGRHRPADLGALTAR